MNAFAEIAPWLVFLPVVGGFVGGFIWVGRISQKVEGIAELRNDFIKLDSKTDSILLLLAGDQYGHLQAKIAADARRRGAL